MVLRRQRLVIPGRMEKNAWRDEEEKGGETFLMRPSPSLLALPNRLPRHSAGPLGQLLCLLFERYRAHGLS